MRSCTNIWICSRKIILLLLIDLEMALSWQPCCGWLLKITIDENSHHETNLKEYLIRKQQFIARLSAKKSESHQDLCHNRISVLRIS